MQLTSNSDKITRDYFDSLLIETRYLEIIKPHADHHHCSTARLRSGLRSIRPSGWSV